LWDVCEQLAAPVHFHGSCGVTAGSSAKHWEGYSTRQAHSASTSTSAVTPAQIVPQLIFSGVTERFPNLKFVFAEAGIGGLNYLLASCDHEWETRHLWTEGLSTRPSVAIHRQMFVNFWFEEEASSCVTTSVSTISCGKPISRTSPPIIPSRGIRSSAC